MGTANEQGNHYKKDDWERRMRVALRTLHVASTVFVIGVCIGPAEADTVLGCFERAYDNLHLSRHPDQVVKALKLFIKRAGPNSYYRYEFSLQLTLRGRNELLETGGSC